MKKLSDIILRGAGEKKLFAEAEKFLLNEKKIMDEAAVPVIVLIDASSSMKSYIDIIIRSIESFSRYHAENYQRIDMCIAAIYDSSIILIKNFGETEELLADSQRERLRLLGDRKNDDISPLCVMLNAGYEKLMKRHKQYQFNQNIPVMTVFSDFAANDYSRTNAFENMEELFSIFDKLDTKCSENRLRIAKILCSENPTDPQKKWYYNLAGTAFDISNEVLENVYNSLIEQ